MRNKKKFFDSSNEQKKYTRVKYYPYLLYIPENLEIQEVLAYNPPAFKYHIDCFLYIIHLINAILVRNQDFDIEKHHGFTPIDKTILSKKIHGYKKYIDYLVANEIVQEGTSYMPGFYCKGLRFTKEYRTEVKRVYITKGALIKSLIKKRDNRDLEAEKKLHFLKTFFNPMLTIDVEKVEQFLIEDKDRMRKQLLEERAKYKKKKFAVSIEDTVIMMHNVNKIVADKILFRKNLYLIVDNKAGRFHSPLTQLKRGLRKFISYNGEKLCAIDIVNSQPLIALSVLDSKIFIKNRCNIYLPLYNEDYTGLNVKTEEPEINTTTTISAMFVNLLHQCYQHKDVSDYKAAVLNGHFYESFAKLLEVNNLLPAKILSLSDQNERRKEARDFVKNATFLAFFSKNEDIHRNKYMQAFKKCYPHVYHIFELIKTQPANTRKKKGHNALALLFQRVESNLVLHDVCVDIHNNHPNIPIFTIHDSIVTTKQYVDLVKHIFLTHLFNKFGAYPQLKIEEW